MLELKTINLENSISEEFNNYKVRNTVRAIIFDNENNIALMNVSKDNFHKLPGGGIDEGETKEEALKRECLEEAGVNIEIISELGLISEIKKTSETIQNSYCYTAKVIGEKGEPYFTEKEKVKGFEIKWLSIEEAIKTVEEDGFSNIIGEYISIREKIILEEVKR